MHDPFDAEKRPLIMRLRRLRRRAWMALTWERATAAFWQVDCWLLFFAGLWLLGLPSVFGAAGSGLALVIFFCGLVYFLYGALQTFHWPNRHDIDRRLERHNDFPHRPLEYIEDRLANPQKEETRTLWKTGRDSAFRIVAKLRAPWPRPVLARKDPFALRTLAFLILVAGVAVAGPQWRERLAFGLFPFSVHWEDRVSDNIVIWITPPEYTRLPQVTLRGSGISKDVIKVAQGSVIKARVRSGIGRPSLMVDDKKIPMQALDKKSWGVKIQAEPARSIKVVQLFLPRAAIPVEFIPDALPRISLKGKPQSLPKGTLQIPLAVNDDYGVTEMTLRVTLDPSAGTVPLGTSVEDTRTIMSAPATETELKPIYDLAWHPWAGLPVIIKIEAKDGLNQTAGIPPLHMTLPERQFLDPVAKQLVDMRKKLLRAPDDAEADKAVQLENILIRPGLYRGDISVFLSLRSMISRLHYAPGRKTALALIPQLWDTALRIEDGNLTLAARNMRDAKEALENLLNNPDATDEQIAAAMEDLRQAMAAYFQEIFREMQKRMADGKLPQDQFSPETLSRSLDVDALSAFLDQLQVEAQRGSRNNARQMLSQLQNLMDRMDPSLSMDIPPQLQALAEGVNALKKLIEWQRELLEQTKKQADLMQNTFPPSYPDFLPPENDLFEDGAGGEMPPPPQETPREMKDITPRTVSTQVAKSEQERLRFILGDVMRDAGEKLGDIPANMQDAEQSMRSSSDSLGDNRPDLSIPQQEKALEHLEKSMENMNQQMAAMMKNMALFSFGMGPLDPLGRPMGEGDGPGFTTKSRVKIPNEAERKRAQDILKTLRKRAGELQRPDYELDYYRRLMRQF